MLFSDGAEREGRRGSVRGGRGGVWTVWGGGGARRGEGRRHCNEEKNEKY